MSVIDVTARDRAMLLDASECIDLHASELWSGHRNPATDKIEDREISAEYNSMVRTAKRLRALAARARKA